MQQQPTPRERVEPGIYRRTGADGRARYEIAYRDSDGRQRRHVIEGGLKAARSALATVKSDLGRGRRVAPSPKLTFNAAADAWWSAQAVTLRPATVSAYGYALAHLRRAFGSRRLDSLGVDDIARYVAEKHVAGLRAWTVRGHLTVAGRVFEYASRRLGWAGANPVRALDKSERPAGDDGGERRVLDHDELGRLLGAADEPYSTIFAFAASAGTRLGETLGVRWRRLDLDAGVVSITHQLDRRGDYVPLKTRRSRRTVELPTELCARLREHKLRSPATGPDDYVFVSRSGEPLDHRNVAGRALRRAVERAGIAAPAPTFHGLRHAHASAWIASGGDLAELSARLGHRDAAITASVYVHEFEAAGRSDARRDRLDALYGSAMSASGRSGAQRAMLAEGREVADLQVKRNAAQ